MKDNAHGIIFDLDMTLVDTGCLLQLREQRKWDEVYKYIPNTKIFPNILQLLEELNNIYKIGIVTSAPRTYAKRICCYHRINIPILIAYHDTVKHKPDPDPILKGIELLKTTPSQTYCVGDEMRDIESALRASAKPIGVTWGLGHKTEMCLTDSFAIVDSVEELKTLLTKNHIL